MSELIYITIYIIYYLVNIHIYEYIYTYAHIVPPPSTAQSTATVMQPLLIAGVLAISDVAPVTIEKVPVINKGDW